MLEIRPLFAASWLHQQPSWLIGLCLAAGMFAVSRVGCWAGMRWQDRSSDGGRGHFSAVQAALLGLLALLLGFTLNMADQRSESRRQLMLDDAVALGALNLRAGFLPESSAATFRQLLGQYVEQQAVASHARLRRESAEFEAEAARAEELHRGMTAIVRAELQMPQPARGVELMVGQLSDVLAVHRRWVTSMETCVPPAILVLLISAALTTAGIVGFSGGLAGQRALPQSVLLTVFVCGIFFVVHDLDTPDAGLSVSERQPLLHLAEVIKKETLPQP